MTLFLPWPDATKNHAPVVHQMEAALASELKQRLPDGLECISVATADHRARIARTQYSSLKLNISDPTCRHRLTRQPKNTAPLQGWTQI